MKTSTNSLYLWPLRHIKSIILWLSISLTLPVWAAPPDESLVEVTYYVKTSGDDTNSGTSEASPFKTIGKALATANDDGQHSKILIYPGTYREGNLKTEAKASTEAKLLVIEGTEKGQVILSGSDAYPTSAWTDEGNGIYSTPWDKDWYFWDGNWGKSGPRNILGHRREMVFVDGVLLSQVMIEDWTYTYKNVTGNGIGTWTYNSYQGPSALTAGSYGLSDLSYGAQQGKLFIKLPAGKSISTANVEVATRTNGLLIRKSNTVVRNLIIEHYASKIPRVDGTYALGWYKQDYYQWREENALQNSLIEDCEIRWNNGDGISPLGHLNNTFRNSKAHHNGGNGGSSAYIGYSDWSDLEFSDNNWRVSDYGGKDSWFVAGFKFGWCSKYVNFTRVKALNNRGAGFWDDGNSFNNVWKHCVFKGNKTGLFIEISEGPSLVDSCELSENREFGLHLSLTRHTQVTNNRFINNQQAGMMIVAKNKDRIESFPSEFKGPNLVVNADGKAVFNAEDVDFYDNVVTTNQGVESYMIQPEFQYGGDASWNTNVLDGWEGDRNTYYNPDNEQVFWLSGSTATDLAGWKERLSTAQTGQSTSQEVNSVWGAPSVSESVWLEAECSTVGNLWDTKQSSQASGGEYLQIKPGNNAYNYAPKNADDRLGFTFNVSEAGSYKVWGRVKCATNNDDSFWVQVDEGSWTQWNNLNNGGVWTWNDVHETRNGDQAVAYDLSAGSHTLNVAYREDGAQLDKLVVIPTAQAAPSDLGGDDTGCSSPFEDLTLEAEEATLSQAVVENNHPGYTGSGFVNYNNEAGSYVEWQVNVGTAGSYALSFRYANGSTVNRPCAISVNGTVVNAGLLFSPTDAWTSYLYSEEMTVSLQEGLNTVRAKANNGSGGPNMDHLLVSTSSLARNGDMVEGKTGHIPSRERSLQVYPNPTSGLLRLQGADEGSVQVYDLQGQLRLTGELDQNRELDVSTLPAGLYILNVKQEGRPLSIKIIKQ